MTEPKKFILTMELTPRFMSEAALRKHISDHRWRNIIKKDLIAQHGLVCEICSFSTTNANHIDAHEVFDYAEDGSVRLVEIKLLCTWCHDVKDFAHTERLISQNVKPPERRQLVIDHFCRLNECTAIEFDRHYDDARRQVQEVEKRYGPVIAPDNVHYGDYHDHYLKAQDPARFTEWTAAQRAIAVAIRNGLHEDYREDAIEIARYDKDFRAKILSLVRSEDYDAAVCLVIETLRENLDLDDEPLRDDEPVFGSVGQLYGHH